MIRSQGFRPGLVQGFLDNWMEGTRLDFKWIPYNTRVNDGKGEFAKDLIAFANTAGRTNQPCWIVFGVRDDKSAVQDLRYHDAKGGIWPEEKLNTVGKIVHHQQDHIEKIFHEIAVEWVGPDIPIFSLHFGEVDRIFLSYLEISPNSASEPYYLRKSFKSHTTRTIFVRKNSSSVRLAPSEKDCFKFFSEAVYLQDDDWRRLVEAHRHGDFHEAEFLVPGYRPEIAGDSGDIVQRVIDLLENSHNKFIQIIGNAGEGKSIVLQRIAFELAIKHPGSDQEVFTRRKGFGIDSVIQGKLSDDYSVGSIEDELEVVPEKIVSVYMPLRHHFDSEEAFKETLLKTLINYLVGGELDFGPEAYDRPDTLDARYRGVSNLDQVFRIPGSKWVLLLDGVDEITNANEFAPLLKNIIVRLPSNVKVVLTSRPYAALESDVRLSIRPLSKEEIIDITKAKILDHGVDENDPLDPIDIFEKAVSNIDKFPELLALLQRQRAITGYIEFLFDKKRHFLSQIDEKPSSNILVETSIQHVSGDSDLPIVISLDSESENFLFEENPSEMALDEEGNWEGENETEKASRNEESRTEEDDYKNWNPSVVWILKSIVAYMNEEEIKRRREAGEIKLEHIGSEAQTEIEEASWGTDWSINRLQGNSVSAHSRAWNEYIGFIQRENPKGRWYKYACAALQKYFAAEFAFDALRYEIEDLQNEFLNRGTGNLATKEVVSFYNELCAENGKTHRAIRLEDSYVN